MGVCGTGTWDWNVGLDFFNWNVGLQHGTGMWDWIFNWNLGLEQGTAIKCLVHGRTKAGITLFTQLLLLIYSIAC